MHGIEKNPKGAAMSSDKKVDLPKKDIFSLVLVFPHGATVNSIQRIAQMSESIVTAGISEGGYTPLSKYGVFDPECKYSDDSMQFIFGYDHTHIQDVP
jgi:hypothetical protein